MRRRLALLLAAFLGFSAVTVVVVAGSQPATAAGLLQGRLASAVDNDLFLPGATVNLRTVTESGPGVVVDTDTTDSDGRFALDAGPTPDDEYYVQVTLNNYRGGYVGGAVDDDNYVQFDASFAATYSPGVNLGRVFIVPSFIRGVLINAATGARVPNVKVSVRPGDDLTKPEGVDFTNAKGVFKVKDIECEDDCALYFLGHPQHYENGYWSCARTVVPTWGDACASSLGNIGRVRIDHL
jgi:hypothetical protein